MFYGWGNNMEILSYCDVVLLGEIEIDLCAIYYKVKITCTPTFCEGAIIAKLPSCVMCQIGKKNPVIDEPPSHFVFKCAPPV